MTRTAAVVVGIVLGVAPTGTRAQALMPGSAIRQPSRTHVAEVTALPAWFADRARCRAPSMATFGGHPARAASRRSPVVAGTLGFVVPGAGHVYAGETRRGVAVFAITMAGAFFALSDGTSSAAAAAGSVVYVGGWTFSVVDGSLAAGRHNRRRQRD